MHNILLIDDDLKLGDLLKRYFIQHDLALTHATVPSEGFALIKDAEYALIILDIMLPEIDGFEVCRRIRQSHDTPILMLTARGEVVDRIVGLELGADDYLSKPFEPRELVARISRILKRTQSSAAKSNHLIFNNLSIDTKKMEVILDGQVIVLSHLEFRLLELFSRQPGITLSRDEILNALRGTDADLFTRSVDILVSRLRQKLKPYEPIKTVRSAGYQFTGVVE